MADDSTRAHPRYPVGWRATFRCSSWEIAAKVAVANVSRRGMFLRTKHPPASGTTVELTLELPDGNSLRLDGVVRYAVEDGAPDGRVAGAGVELDARHDVELSRLEDAARNEQASREIVAGTLGRITLTMPPLPLDNDAVGTGPPIVVPTMASASAQRPRTQPPEPEPVMIPPPLPVESSTSYSMHKPRRK